MTVILTRARPQMGEIQIVRSKESIPEGQRLNKEQGWDVYGRSQGLQDPPDGHGGPALESCEKWPRKVIWRQILKSPGCQARMWS